MLTAFFRAIEDLSAPPLRRVVMLSLVLAVITFVVLWSGAATLLSHYGSFGWWPLDWLVGIFGGFAVLVLSWLLFPAILTIVMSFFLDRVAGAVEARDYPERGPARGVPFGDMVSAALRLMVLSVILNLLALPLYLLLPGVNFFVFLGLNGYLLGRAYFEVVALRRLDMAAMKAVRQRFGGRVFIGGLVIAGLFSVPLVNLVAPVIATAFMVHLFQGLRQLEPQAALR